MVRVGTAAGCRNRGSDQSLSPTIITALYKTKIQGNTATKLFIELAMNPDYTLWYGWNEMVQDLDEIRIMAKEMREKQKTE